MFTGGFMKELIETLYENKHIGPDLDPERWRIDYHKWTAYQGEYLKLLYDDLAQEAGVTVRYYTQLVDVVRDDSDNRIRAAVLSSVGRTYAVAANTFIDCTGNADLAHLAGATCMAPDPENPRVIPSTLCSMMAGIDWDVFSQAQEHEAVKTALDDGFFTQLDRHFVGLWRVNNTCAYLNAGHVFGLDARNGKSLSEGTAFGRKLIQEYLAFYRKYVNGCRNMELVATAPMMGVRECRRIVGEACLTEDDYHNWRQYPDQIAVYNRFLDVHPQDLSKEEYDRFMSDRKFTKSGKGKYFGIPYGVLVPKGWRNVWIAGRCVSADRRIIGSIRAQPACGMMGEAAGTAAAQSVSTGQDACNLNTEQLVETLRNANAYLPQDKLSSEMTRNEFPM
jgi:hypothetical protein